MSNVNATIAGLADKLDRLGATVAGLEARILELEQRPRTAVASRPRTPGGPDAEPEPPQPPAPPTPPQRKPR
jgi:hypothetical protein